MTIKAQVEDGNGNKGTLTLIDVDRRVRQLENVKVKNGTERTMPINEAVGEIWECTHVLRDLKTVIDITHKYPRLIRFLKWFFSIAGIMQLIRWAWDYREWIDSLIK